MATHFKRVYIPYAVTFNDHDLVDTDPKRLMRTKQTDLNTTNASQDTAISDLVENNDWVVVAAIPVVKTRSHKTDRQESALAYTWTAGVEVILSKNGD